MHFTTYLCPVKIISDLIKEVDVWEGPAEFYIAGIATVVNQQNVVSYTKTCSY